MIFMIVSILLLILFAMGFYFVKVSLYPVTAGYEEIYNNELSKGYFEEEYYNNLEKKEFYTESEFGYQLHCIWFPNKNSVKTVIIAHGYTVNMYSSIRYLRMFHDKGFNVLIYDQRYHGKSGGKNCTMGYFEKYDLKTLVTWVQRKTGEESIIGIHGESMGASTAIMHAAIDDRIAFTISDCAYEDLYRQFRYKLKEEYKLPSFPMLDVANIATKIVTNIFYQNVSPINDIPKIQTPILFIHGDSDTFTLSSHSIHMYEKTQGVKQLYLANGANHAESLYVNKSQYEKVVYQFLNSLELV